MQIGVITNPNSRKNKHRPDRAARLQSIVGALGEVHTTESVDSIKPILREFLRKRATYWVADGGDGALHWMLRSGMELLEEDEFAGETVTLPMTLPTKGGTIDFVANNVGINGTAESLLARLRAAIERGHHIEEVEVDSMRIEGVELDEHGVEQPFVTYGFGSAAGGVGQRFFSKYYDDEDPNPGTIVKILAKTMMSMPVALSPLRALPMLPHDLRTYAREFFEPTPAKITLDGMVLDGNAFTGIHIASMSINLGNVLRFFNKAEADGLMHAIVGSPTPLALLWNLPKMVVGSELRARNLVDRPCRELTMEAIGDEHLEPIIDGEWYKNVRKMTFKLGPRVRIPKVVADAPYR